MKIKLKNGIIFDTDVHPALQYFKKENIKEILKLYKKALELRKK